MEIFFGWFILSIFVSIMGQKRNIGFLGAFGVSLLLGPLIGFIITPFSKKKESQIDTNQIIKDYINNFKYGIQ